MRMMRAPQVRAEPSTLIYRVRVIRGVFSTSSTQALEQKLESELKPARVVRPG
jgi:hypothetical protein